MNLHLPTRDFVIVKQCISQSVKYFTKRKTFVKYLVVQLFKFPMFPLRFLCTQKMCIKIVADSGCLTSRGQKRGHQRYAVGHQHTERHDAFMMKQSHPQLRLLLFYHVTQTNTHKLFNHSEANRGHLISQHVHVLYTGRAHCLALFHVLFTIVYHGKSYSPSSISYSKLMTSSLCFNLSSNSSKRLAHYLSQLSVAFHPTFSSTFFQKTAALTFDALL